MEFYILIQSEIKTKRESAQYWAIDWKGSTAWVIECYTETNSFSFQKTHIISFALFARHKATQITDKEYFDKIDSISNKLIQIKETIKDIIQNQ